MKGGKDSDSERTGAVKGEGEKPWRRDNGMEVKVREE